MQPEAGGYDKWRARRELAATTARTAAAAVPAALRQRSVGGRGVNFVGYGPGSGLSMGDLGELLQRGLAASGRVVENHPISVTASSPPLQRSLRVHNATVALVQSGHVPTAVLQLPRLFAGSRFRAAVVHYELPQIPLTQRLGIPFVDELWTTSEFVRDAFACVTRKRVRVVPLPAPVAVAAGGALRQHLGLRDEYLFGYQFDLASSGERKAPDVVARAYLRAFPTPSPEVRLLLKAVHASMSPRVWAEVQRLVDGRPDVLLVDEYWPKDVVDAFFADVDCYVSLHRAEGYGLTLARAMAAGKPVIATGYSGNLTFMTEETSVLVPWTPVRVGPDPVYPAAGTWADPDIAVAAEALQRLARDPAVGRALGARAREHIRSTQTEARCAAWLDDVLPA